jgi:hypothetical protein
MVLEAVCGDLVPKIAEVVIGKRLCGNLLDDGKKVVKRSYSAERRSVARAAKAAGRGQ